MDRPIKIRHEEKQHTPRVGIRQRELVQHDEKQHTPRVGIRQRELVQHDEKQHTPRVGIRQRELVQHDEKLQPYPGNDGKVRTKFQVRNVPLFLIMAGSILLFGCRTVYKYLVAGMHSTPSGKSGGGGDNQKRLEEILNHYSAKSQSTRTALYDA